MHVVAQATKQLLRRRAQVEHRGPLVKGPSVLLAQHGTTAGGQHARAALRQGVDDVLLDVPERRLAMGVEEVADRAADALLDLVVAVDERQAEVTRKMAPDRGLPSAGHADEGDGAGHATHEVTRRDASGIDGAVPEIAIGRR